MAPIYVSEHIDRWALNGWNFQPRKQLLSLTSAVRITLLSWNIEQRRRMWTVTWCGVSRRSTMLRAGTRGGGGLNRCWGRAWIYTRSASPDSSSVFCLCVCVFFSSSACIYALDNAEVETLNDWISSFFHHLNEIIAENHCAGFKAPCLSCSPTLLCAALSVRCNIDCDCPIM